MTDVSNPPRARRPELERAYQHMTDLASAVDLSGMTEPGAMWLKATRATLPRYGDVGPPVDLSGVTFQTVDAGGVPAEWVCAENADPAFRLVWLHGGGWAAGSPQDYRSISATLARLSGASILMVDYRLAPEHRYPAGLDDCGKAYAWALVNAPAGPRSASDAASDRVCLMGDSAGGNLSAATCVRLAGSGARMPDRLVLIAATLDHVGSATRVGVDDPICTPDALAITTAAYLTAAHDASEPEVSPMFASAEQLARFPATLIQVSTIEALLDENRRFADRLGAAGVRTTLSLWPELPHVWHAFVGLFPEATEALTEIAGFVRR